MLDASLLPLDDARVRLRPLLPEDAADYAAGTADPAVREFAHLPEPEYTEASVRAMIAGTAAGGLAAGDLAVLAIADAATDAFAGSLVLFDVCAGEDGAPEAEVGFWLHPAHRGGGRARAALDLAARWAGSCGLHRLRARTAEGNAASRRVLAGAGFAETGSAEGTAPSGETVALIHAVRPVYPAVRLPLRTERLTLRLHREGDEDWLHRIYGRADVARFLLEGPWTAEEAAARLAERRTRTGLEGDAGALALVVEHAGTPVGDVALWLTDRQRRIAEIGWVLDPERGGRGYAAEAVSAVLRLALADPRAGGLGLHRVAAQMDARNTASARLAERAGMTREAHLRSDWWSKGEWTDTVVFGALSGDPGLGAVPRG